MFDFPQNCKHRYNGKWFNGMQFFPCGFRERYATDCPSCRAIDGGMCRRVLYLLKRKISMSGIYKIERDKKGRLKSSKIPDIDELFSKGFLPVNDTKGEFGIRKMLVGNCNVSGLYKTYRDVRGRFTKTVKIKDIASVVGYIEDKQFYTPYFRLLGKPSGFGVEMVECPYCYQGYDANKNTRCPHCGE